MNVHYESTVSVLLGFTNIQHAFVRHKIVPVLMKAYMHSYMACGVYDLQSSSFCSGISTRFLYVHSSVDH